MSDEQQMEDKLEVKIGEYKGSPVISLPLTADGRVLFTFGLTKAKAIVKYFDEIEKFIEEHDQTKK